MNGFPMIDVRLFDIALSIVGFLGYLMIRETFRRLEGLEKQTAEMVRDVMDYRASMPEKYVSKSDHDKQLDAIFELLRRIEGKLDGKADK